MTIFHISLFCLSGSEHINLIFEFAGWILDLNPEEGLKIFIEDLQEVENLPRPKVLDYLLRTHKSLVIPYLVSHTNPLYLVFINS